jgi:hypothetical protein
MTRGKSIAALSLIALAGSLAAMAEDKKHFQPENLVVSRSVYDNNPANVRMGAILPPNCVPALCATGSKAHPFKSAPADGTYPTVFNNNLYDGSFGLTSKIFLDQITRSGEFVNTLEVPNSADPGITGTSDQLVTSFSSKSELALNRSTDGKYVTFMGYVAPIDTLDVSNSNTPGIVDATNPVPSSFLRAVAQVDRDGVFQFTETKAYSGNNGRAAILNNRHGFNSVYTAGNAGEPGERAVSG